tara:strand:+ start:2502 stop:2807 length:306 start_codon:yes stop_codon:yes gene_type:complete
MKSKLFTIKNLVLSSALFLIASCSEDDCANCHLVVMNADGSETELLDLPEYCGDELHEIEENGYVFNDTIFVDSQGNLLLTPVAPGDDVEVHCGEDHDHDH